MASGCRIGRPAYHVYFSQESVIGIEKKFETHGKELCLVPRPRVPITPPPRPTGCNDLVAGAEPERL